MCFSQQGERIVAKYRAGSHRAPDAKGHGHRPDAENRARAVGESEPAHIPQIDSKVLDAPEHPDPGLLTRCGPARPKRIVRPGLEQPRLDLRRRRVQEEKRGMLFQYLSQAGHRKPTQGLSRPPCKDAPVPMQGGEWPRCFSGSLLASDRKSAV